MTAGAGDDTQLVIYREQANRTLRAALAQGRLTEDEYDERTGQAAASRSRAELAALTADLPVGRTDAPIRPPRARDAWIGVGVIIAAVGVLVDVRHQKRSGGQLPPVDRGQQHTAEAAQKNLARRQSDDERSAHRWRHRSMIMAEVRPRGS